MKIVIDIPKEDYKRMKEQSMFGRADVWRKAIQNGTPLPKGHGNIYDENDIKKGIENPYQCQTVLNGLKLIKPIIEADKAESEDKYGKID